MKRLIAICCCLTFASASVAAKEKAAAPTPAPVAMEHLQAAVDARMMGQLKSLIERAKLARQEGSELTLYLSEYYLGTGAYDQALAGFRGIAGEAALAARAHQGAGIAAYRLSRHAEAVTELRAATALDADLRRAWNALGAAADAVRDWPLAEEAYGQALRLSPGDADILSNRGYSRILQRRDADAISDLTKAVMAAPTSERIRNNLRIALALGGKYDEAVAGTDSRQVHKQLNNIGYAAMLRGDYVTAESYFNQAIDRSDVYYEPAHRNLILLEDMKRRGQQSAVIGS